MRIFEDLEKVLRTEIAVGLGIKSLTPDEDLLQQGILDSLGIMKLIVYIEESYGIKIEDEEIIPENFQSLNSMVTFIGLKIQNKQV
jgi:acyl carrier protein